MWRWQKSVKSCDFTNLFLTLIFFYKHIQKETKTKILGIGTKLLVGQHLIYDRSFMTVTVKLLTIKWITILKNIE